MGEAPGGRGLLLCFAVLRGCWRGCSSGTQGRVLELWVQPGSRQRAAPLALGQPGASEMIKPRVPLGNPSSPISKAGTRGAVLRAPGRGGCAACGHQLRTLQLGRNVPGMSF